MAIAPGSIFPRNGVAPAQAALGSDTSARATCAELFYKASCNPRFDPQAMNSIMSEMLNAVNGTCDPDQPDGGPDWDCARQDNLLRAMCRHFNEKLFDCLDQNFPMSGQVCSVEQLVLATDEDGCRRIARYSASSSRLGVATTCAIVGEGNAVLVPADPSNPATFYNKIQLDADINAGTVDEALLQSLKVLDIVFDVPCDGTVVEFASQLTTVFQPNANGGNGAASVLGWRINNQWELNGAGQSPITARFTNFQNETSGSQLRVLSAGQHHIEIFVLASNAALPPAQASVACYRGVATGGIAASVALR